MAELRQRVGARIYQLRKRQGMTQAQLAEAIGLGDHSISLIERGLRAPSFDALERIAKALGVEVRELFNFNEKKIQPQETRHELARLATLLEDRSDEEIRLVYRVAREMFRQDK